MSEKEAKVNGKVNIYLSSDKPIDQSQLKNLLRKFADTCGRLRYKQLTKGVTIKQGDTSLRAIVETGLCEYESCAAAERAHDKTLQWRLTGSGLIGKCPVLKTDIAYVKFKQSAQPEER